MKETDCCKIFDKESWDDKTFIWNDKKFISSEAITFFNMPLNYGKVITKLINEAKEERNTDDVCLTEHISNFKMKILLSVNKELDETNNETLSGTFYSKVYEGSYNNIPNWIKDFKTRVEDDSKIYFWYTTCPKCAKTYGKNYVVLITKIAD